MLLKNKQIGFFLIEVLLALLIFSSGIIVVIKTYSLSLKVQKHTQYQTSAVLLANRLQEQIEIAILEDIKGEEYIESKLFKWEAVEEKISFKEGLELITVKVKWTERLKDYEFSISNIYPENFLDNVLQKNKGLYSY